MTNWPIHSNKALVVCGSMNAKAEDRTLDRESVYPLQVVYEDRIEQARAFQAIGSLGISSLAFDEDAGRCFGTTGDDLFRLDFASRKSTPLDVDDLGGVHEISLIENQLWLANTRYDELVAVDPKRGVVVKRLDLVEQFLAGGRANASVARGARNGNFHVNQVFKGVDGHRYALVHWVEGRQSMKKLSSVMVKMHGGGFGGVLNLDTGHSIRLGLSAPHSARCVDGFTWIMNSGRAKVSVFDPDWKQVSVYPTAGWGRGAAYDADRKSVYLGISELRKRYWKIAAIDPGIPNMVEVVSAEGVSQARIGLAHVEQVNNVYLVGKETAGRLCSEDWHFD